MFYSELLFRLDFWKSSKPCHIGIHWIALTENSQMSTHVLGFQSFFRTYASFCIGQSNHQHKGFYPSSNASEYHLFDKLCSELQGGVHSPGRNGLVPVEMPCFPGTCCMSCRVRNWIRVQAVLGESHSVCVCPKSLPGHRHHCLHSLSQEGVWMSFWTLKPLKSTTQDTLFFLRGKC